MFCGCDCVRVLVAASVRQGTVALLKRARDIYVQHPGVGPRIVSHYGSDWGLSAMTKFLSQLLIQGRLKEFCAARTVSACGSAESDSS